MDSNYSLADLAAVTKGESGMGGGALWLVVLFLFLFAGGFGMGGGGAYATKDDISAAINAQTSISTSGTSKPPRRFESCKPCSGRADLVSILVSIFLQKFANK